MADQMQKQSVSVEQFPPERRAKPRNPIVEGIRKTFRIFPKPMPWGPSTWRHMRPEGEARLRELYRERKKAGL